MSSTPKGRVTFFFTDIQGSTKLWERDARRMQAALVRHDEILESNGEALCGYVFKMVGDACCCAAFSTTPEALEAEVAARRTISSEPWEEGFRLRVRMALHAGAAEEDIDAPMLAVERPLQGPYLAAARSRLGTAAWEEGRSMTTEEAVAYALNVEDRA